MYKLINYLRIYFRIYREFQLITIDYLQGYIQIPTRVSSIPVIYRMLNKDDTRRTPKWESEHASAFD